MELNKTFGLSWFYYPLLLLGLVLFSKKIFAQQEPSIDQKPVFINCNYFSGHIFQHDKNISHTIRNYVNGLNVSVNDILLLRTKQNDRNHELLVDLGLFYLDHGYDFLGKNIGLTFGKSNQFVLYRKLTLFASWSYGIIYNTKTYSKQNNKNQAVASDLSFLNRIEFRLTYPVYKNWYALAAVGVNHMSNGASREPNLGYNIFTSEIGMAYLLKKKTIPQKEKLNPGSKKYYFHLMEGCYLSNTDSWSEKKYTILVLHHQIERILSLHHSLIVSFDYCHDRRFPYSKERKDNQLNNEYNFYGISSGLTWKLTFIELVGTVGVNLSTPWYEKNKWYSELYTKIYAADQVYFYTGMKAQRFNAAYFVLGLGLKL